MEASADDLFQEALRLPPDARTALIELLLNSLEPEDDDSEGAWQVEIGRRVDEIQRDAVDLVPWSIVRRRLRIE